MIKTVIFDLDDTLAPEMSFVRSGYMAIAQSVAAFRTSGIKENIYTEAPEGSFDPGEYREIYNALMDAFYKDPRHVFDSVLYQLQIPYDTDDIKKLVIHYRNHSIRTDIYKYYDDVKSSLKQLKEKGIRLGILTDGFVQSQINKLKALGITRVKGNTSPSGDMAGVFDSIMITAEAGDDFEKPSEKGFLAVCEYLNTTPEEMLYVGDNPQKDFYIKAKLPITTARIIRPESVYENADYREGLKEDFRIETLTELLPVLSRF